MNTDPTTRIDAYDQATLQLTKAQTLAELLYRSHDGALPGRTVIETGCMLVELLADVRESIAQLDAVVGRDAGKA